MHITDNIQQFSKDRYGYMEKFAVVTGGFGGIGKAICKALGQDGYTIISTFMRPGREQAWCDELNEMGIKAHAIQCDVSNFEQCQTFAHAVHEQYGKISVLVNNAGIARDATLRKMPIDKWEQVIHTNLNSVFNMSRAFIDDMTEQKFGRIVNIASVNGQKGQFGQVNYSAAKAGVHGFTMALAQEVARKGVTVNTVSPGYTATEIIEAVPNEILQSICDSTPVGRLGKPEEIAELTRYLVSTPAAFITGANIDINGGLYMQ